MDDNELKKLVEKHNRRRRDQMRIAVMIVCVALLIAIPMLCAWAKTVLPPWASENIIKDGNGTPIGLTAIFAWIFAAIGGMTALGFYEGE